ncbi:MAG: hypothetical protein NZ809_05580 [Thermodesulfovibrio sp.]|nr:hypothetical protein [Thermodesulfovibrio sp.]
MFRYAVVIIMLFLLMGCAEQLKVEISGVGETIPTGVSALSWDGKNLIVAKEGLIAFIDYIDTAALGSIYNYEGHYFFDRYPITIASKDNPTNITGVAWQKTEGGIGYLWVTDIANRRLLKLTPQGDILRQLPIRDFYPEDIVFGGEYLWIADSKRAKIFKVSPEDGSILGQYLSPVTVPTSVAWDGKYLIVGGIINPEFLVKSSENLKIVKLDTETGKVAYEVLIPKHFAKHLDTLSLPVGMVWINEKIWIADRSSGNIIILPDRTIMSEDPKTYKLAITQPKLEKLPLQDKVKPSEIEEVKKAAEEAKKAAEEAKKAAEEAKKAFELIQKK